MFWALHELSCPWVSYNLYFLQGGLLSVSVLWPIYLSPWLILELRSACVHIKLPKHWPPSLGAKLTWQPQRNYLQYRVIVQLQAQRLGNRIALRFLCDLLFMVYYVDKIKWFSSVKTFKPWKVCTINNCGIVLGKCLHNTDNANRRQHQVPL